MPDDNRFAGLSSAVEDDGADDGAETVVETTYEETTDEDGSSEPDHDSTAESTRESSDSPDSESSDDPTAFSFDETTKKTVYVREETIDALEDARALVDAQLRTQHDVRDLTGREFYDAAFRLAADDTDGLIDEIRAERD